jgi:radical SAM superfamily enzyme YgiQ (UPF0313 family)
MFNAFIINLGSTQYSARTLGPHLIATHLRQEGWDIEVVDYGLHWSLEELKELAVSRINRNTKFIGFSHQFTTWGPKFEQYCQWLKQTYPSIFLISGCAINPNYNSSFIDYHIQGYGEYAISELLKYLFGSGSLLKFSMFTKGAKKIIPANDFYQAFPKKSLRAEYQKRDFIEEGEWLSIETSRGCVFSCDFCNFPVLGVKGDYTRDADDFNLELRDNYDRFGVKNYIVADETFNDRTDKITKYANVVEELNFSPSFTGFMRADLLVARPKDREELLRMNFIGHYYGIETFNRASGKSIGKGMDTVRLQEGLVDIKNYFQNNNKKIYRGTISLIVGLPEETLETIENTKQWLIDNWQGQSYYAYSLQIPVDEQDLFSKFGKDYRKYGYEVMSPEEIEARKDKQELYEQYHFASGIIKNSLMWKNKHMDIYQSIQSAIELQDLKLKYPFTIDCWHLSSPGIIGEVEERIQKHHPPDLIEQVFLAKVRRYIKNKLNL